MKQFLESEYADDGFDFDFDFEDDDLDEQGIAECIFRCVESNI